MKKSTLISIILLACIFLTSSCFHKNVQTCDADDIEKVMIYEEDGKEYLICYEFVFQATSKSSGGGMTMISGTNDTRISVYSMETGELIAREKFGKRVEKKAEYLLGITEGNIWMFSMKKGLYSVDPLTLEEKVSQEDFFVKNPELEGNMAIPEWYSVNQFYGYDEVRDGIMLTDIQGFRYFINPKDLKAEKVSDNMDIPTDFFDSFLTTSIMLDSYNYIGFDGDMRKSVTLNNKVLNPGLSYLNANFLLDNNETRMYGNLQTKYSICQNEMDNITHVMDSIEFKYGNEYWYYPDSIGDAYREMENRYDNLERELNNFKSNMGYIEEGSTFSADMLMQPDSTSFFILHQSNTNKDAKLMIARLNLKNKSELKEIWNTELEDIFFDYNSANQTSSFKTVFSKGDPEFDFQYFEMTDNKLLVIYCLYAYCLDINNGEVLWKFKI